MSKNTSKYTKKKHLRKYIKRLEAMVVALREQRKELADALEEAERGNA
jgi:hypothetical protein